MDLMTFVEQLRTDGTLAAIAANPQAQFGIQQRPYLGASLLPERLVESNSYTESGIRYQTVIANDGTRYSPAQKKDTGELVGSFRVELGDQDILREMTGRDYDALRQLLNTNASMDAVLTMTRFVDQTVNRALIEKTELQRWQAIVDASVVRVGDNSFAETVAYPNPSGHRVAAGGTWSNDSYDPYDDLIAMDALLSSKGFTVNRIITSKRVTNILRGNNKIAARAGRVRVLSASDLISRASQDEINAMMANEGMPAFETYDQMYRTQAGTARFLPDTVMVFVCTTGRDETLPVLNGDRFLADTLGYTAIGRPVGEAAPGRSIKLFPFDNKPPRIEVEGKQTSLPVITEPEAIAVITGIA